MAFSYIIYRVNFKLFDLMTCVLKNLQFLSCGGFVLGARNISIIDQTKINSATTSRVRCLQTTAAAAYPVRVVTVALA